MEAIVAQLAETLCEAAANKTLLRIVGGGTKDFYGNPTTGETFSTASHRCNVEYEPTELVTTARRHAADAGRSRFAWFMDMNLLLGY